jgi:hypothetical protein
VTEAWALVSLSARPRRDGLIIQWAIILGDSPPRSYRLLEVPPRRTPLIMGNHPNRPLQPLQRNQCPPLLLPRHQIFNPPPVLYRLQTSQPIFRPTTLSAASMEPPLSPGATVYPLWRRHGQMVANFSILGDNLVVCNYHWRWCSFLTPMYRKPRCWYWRCLWHPTSHQILDR